MSNTPTRVYRPWSIKAPPLHRFNGHSFTIYRLMFPLKNNDSDTLGLLTQLTPLIPIGGTILQPILIVTQQILERAQVRLGQFQSCLTNDVILFAETQIKQKRAERVSK